MARERYVGTWSGRDGSDPKRVYLTIDEDKIVKFMLPVRKGLVKRRLGGAIVLRIERECDAIREATPPAKDK